MNENEYWIIRPCIEGMCQYESLKNGRLDLADIARMNEALDVKYENESRFNDAMKNTNG